MRFKLCPEGHYYEDKLDSCPYCPKTVVQKKKNQDTSTDLNQTQIVTKPLNISDPPKVETPIQKSTHTTNLNISGRKLVGWLVSFSENPLGQDYRLFEGRNTIGTDPTCDIVVKDSKVTSKHLTILFRIDKFKFKDELSTNGTFVNEVFQEEGDLKDGDIIRIGDTTFKFRTVQ